MQRGGATDEIAEVLLSLNNRIEAAPRQSVAQRAQHLGI
jgi:hypothetical protein